MNIFYIPLSCICVMRIGLILHIASYMDFYCFYVNLDYVDVNWFSMSVVFLKEQMGYYVNADCFLDVDLFGL